MRNLYHIYENGRYTLLHSDVDESELHLLIQDFLNRFNFVSHYIRYLERNDGIKIDYGRHNQFLFLGDRDVKD